MTAITPQLLTSSPDVPPRQRGFALVELILTCALTAMMTFILLPKNPDNFSLESATKHLESELRYAQSLARTTSKTHGIRITSANHYDIFSRDHNNITALALSPHDQTPLSVDLEHKYPGTNFKMAFYPQELLFKPDVGAPTANGGLNITLVNKSGKTKHILIRDITGQIDIQ